MQDSTTKCLLLRPLLTKDAPRLLELDTDPAVLRYLGGIGDSRC